MNLVRYRINLGLFISSVILLTIWYIRHIEAYLAQTTIVAAALTLWGIWRFIQPSVKWNPTQSGTPSPQQKEIPFTQKLFIHPSAIKFLIRGILVVVFLHFFTSSIYLHYEGALSGQDSFKVKVTHKNNLLLKHTTVTSFQQSKGRPFFLRYRSINLSFEIEQPFGYESIQKIFRPWSAINVKVPSDFRKKKFHPLALIPILELLNKLPKIEDDTNAQFNLVVQHKNDLYVLKDLRRQVVYAGANESDLKGIVSNAKLAKKLKSNLRTFLLKQGLPENKISMYISQLLNEPAFLPTAKFKTGDIVTWSIKKSNTAEILLTRTVTIESEELIQSVFMTKKGEVSQ